MAARLLQSIADDSPDLQKQIGCMNGIFQLFDRHHILSSRRISRKRLPSPDNSNFSDSSLERDSDNLHHPQTAADVSLNKGLNEKQMLSTESSRASFSSSCSSSFSSLDFKAQEASFDRIVLPEIPSRDPVRRQTTITRHPGPLSFDLRDVVKDSMHREARGLSAKTPAREEAVIHAMNRRDSPGPFQLSNSVNNSYGLEIGRKHNVPIDLKEPPRVFAKLKETPWYYGEARELPRSSYEVKDGSRRHSISKDTPRFSFEVRDAIQCTPKLKELPRLSLDSREGSRRAYSSDSKHAYPSRSSHSGTSMSNDKVSSLPESSATRRRPPSVVAKLMGLEALPDSCLAGDAQSSLTETLSAEDKGQSSKSSISGLTRSLQISGSQKDLPSQQRKNPDFAMKSISSSKFPIEPAPWKQQDGNRSSQMPSFPSVYNEIEKRLKDLEFNESVGNLRALKQILEAMQRKRMPETQKEEQASNVTNRREYQSKPTSLVQNSRSVRQENQRQNNHPSSTISGFDLTAFESPIVIMKPAKLAEKTGISASSVIPIGAISGSHKLQSGGYVDNKKDPTSGTIAKYQSFKQNRRNDTANSIEKKESSHKSMKSPQCQARSQQTLKENRSSSVKNSGTVSPRLQQKKLELERRSRPLTPPLESNKPRRQSSKQATESDSPGGKLGPKSSNLKHCDDQLSEISCESRNMSCQEDETSLPSDSITVSDSKTDVEVTSSLKTAESETNGSHSFSMKAKKQLVSGSMQKRLTPRLDEDESVAELATDAEHLSPVSVLDVSVCGDDVPSPPVKQISDVPGGGDAHKSKANESEDHWNHADGILSYSNGSRQINRQKLQSIDHLVQKLRRLNSNHDEARNDYIASLCENTNPDHRYISEILLASGLLLRDLSSELLTFQLHSSGHLINPELFFVLEQTKTSSLLPKEECSPRKISKLKLNPEKTHRKLIFDAVNEIIGFKLALVCSSPDPWPKPNRLTKKTLSAQKLLKELCFEIEKIQTNKKTPEFSLQDEEHDLKSILHEDVMHGCGSEIWRDFNNEIGGVVLDVERLLFKDLVDEIVIGEAACLRVKPGRRRKPVSK